MTYRRKKIAAVGIAAATMVAVTLIAVPGFATGPIGGFSPSLISFGTFGPFDVKAEKDGKWDLMLKSKGQTDVRVTRVSFPAGSSSGWHSHPGPNLLTVTQGTVVEYEGSNPVCPHTTYTRGDTFGDSGGETVHLVRNNTGSPAEVIAVAFYPQGATPTTNTSKPTNCSIEH